MKYGTTYSIADFCDRLIPLSKPANTKLVKKTLDGLKRLALVQNENAWITIQATLSAGIWIHFQGRPYCLINPAQDFLRVGAAYRNPEAATALTSSLDVLISTNGITEIKNPNLKQWRFPAEALPNLWEFFEALPHPKASDQESREQKHPRNFSGEDRQAALQDFIKRGRICSGVGGKIVSHKLGEFDRIEYDHILPYAKGGASTYQNLAILCVACNREKSATAL